MNTNLNKTFIRLPVEEVCVQLEKHLLEDGFRCWKIPSFQEILDASPGHMERKLIVFSVYNPYLHKEMISMSPLEGIVVPCLISVIETYPGETAVVPCNPTELILSNMQDPALSHLAAEVSKRLDSVINGLKVLLDRDPDLVTSWE